MVAMNPLAEDVDEQLDERFIDLIATVEALVDVEFEAIMRAGCTRSAVVESVLARRPPRDDERQRCVHYGALPSAVASATVEESERSPPPRMRHPSASC